MLVLLLHAFQLLVDCLDQLHRDGLQEGCRPYHHFLLIGILAEHGCLTA